MELVKEKVLVIELGEKIFLPVYCSVDKEGFQIEYSPFKALKVFLQNIVDEEDRINITSNLFEDKLSREEELPVAYVRDGREHLIQAFGTRTGRTTYINTNMYNEYEFDLTKMVNAKEAEKITKGIEGERIEEIKEDIDFEMGE